MNEPTNEKTNQNPNKKLPKWAVVLIVFGATLTLIPPAIMFITACFLHTKPQVVVPTPSEEIVETCPNGVAPGDDLHDGKIDFKKPIIYLYPTEELQVNVELGHPDEITCSYPDYKNGWSVVAQPNGDLVDCKTGRNLYALYYESESIGGCNIAMTGFVVKSEDTISFLEEKLAILGLNEHEAEEFIVYWLPILQSNNYNYIRFATRSDIDRIMPLTVTPTPDTTIRVWMYFKGLEQPFDIQEQHLESVTREGFAVVEWGGAELNSVFIRKPIDHNCIIKKPVIEMPIIKPPRENRGSNK